MKHLFNTLSKLATVAVVGLSISSCNRAEYAMLPKTTPYHATYGSVTKVAPVEASKEATVVAEATPIQTEQAVVVEAPVAATPATTTPAAAPATRSARVVHTTTPDAAPKKMSVPQRALLAKVNKKVDKLVSKAQTMKSKEAASHEDANALNRNIKVGILLILIGVLLGIIGGVLGVVGSIVALIGVVLIILGLLDEI
jgi:hypothetical protein